jgi:hypothetical protein
VFHPKLLSAAAVLGSRSMAPARPDEPTEASIAEAIQKLSPAEAEFFLYKLERAILRRRIQLWGYLGSLAVWAVAMFFSLAYYGGADPESFRAWVFLLPFAAIGVVLWVVGTIADRVAAAPPPGNAPAAPRAAARSSKSPRES